MMPPKSSQYKIMPPKAHQMNEAPSLTYCSPWYPLLSYTASHAPPFSHPDFYYSPISQRLPIFSHIVLSMSPFLTQGMHPKVIHINNTPSLTKNASHVPSSNTDCSPYLPFPMPPSYRDCFVCCTLSHI